MKTDTKLKRPFDVTIVGGLGHVGLPLGLVFAKKGLKVCLYDLDAKKAKLVKKGVMPFIEYGAEPVLRKTLKNRKLTVSNSIISVSKARYVVIAIGTTIDELLNPRVRSFLECFEEIRKHLRKDQTVIVRSTVYPHTCRRMFKLLGGDRSWRVAYCPERIVQGHAVKELCELPQIVAGMTDEAVEDAARLFGRISPKIIKVPMEAAELIKLFSNAWRYIQFAVTNQFYMIAHSYGIDYDKVREAMVEEYGRAANLPTAGFAAGPCLLKDTMQLEAFYGTKFFLGHAAMMVNEGLPGFIVDDMKNRYDLSITRVGILGMAFKADIDDTRDSLSYKLGKILRFYGATVYYSDEYAQDPTFVPKEKLIESSDVIIVGVPHSQYRELVIPKSKEVIDLWGAVKRI
ncbi:MAG: nucleotide sugar dehydrogenase [Candidatus Omnitrophota bacterium]